MEQQGSGINRPSAGAGPQGGEARYGGGANRQRFADVVRIEGMNGGFIRREDERRLLHEGVSRYGLTLDDARSVILSTCSDSNVALQKEADDEVAELINLQASRSRQRRLSRRDFEQAARMYRAKARSRISDEEARRRVKAVMEETGVQPKASGWLIPSRRWYNAIRTS